MMIPHTIRSYIYWLKIFIVKTLFTCQNNGIYKLATLVPYVMLKLVKSIKPVAKLGTIFKLDIL